MLTFTQVIYFHKKKLHIPLHHILGGAIDIKKFLSKYQNELFNGYLSIKFNHVEGSLNTLAAPLVAPLMFVEVFILNSIMIQCSSLPISNVFRPPSVFQISWNTTSAVFSSNWILDNFARTCTVSVLQIFWNGFDSSRFEIEVHVTKFTLVMIAIPIYL